LPDTLEVVLFVTGPTKYLLSGANNGWSSGLTALCNTGHSAPPPGTSSRPGPGRGSAARPPTISESRPHWRLPPPTPPGGGYTRPRPTHPTGATRGGGHLEPAQPFQLPGATNIPALRLTGDDTRLRMVERGGQLVIEVETEAPGQLPSLRPDTFRATAGPRPGVGAGSGHQIPSSSIHPLQPGEEVVG
jgi:hypothetical protein